MLQVVEFYSSSELMYDLCPKRIKENRRWANTLTSSWTRSPSLGMCGSFSSSPRTCASLPATALTTAPTVDAATPRTESATDRMGVGIQLRSHVGHTAIVV